MCKAVKHNLNVVLSPVKISSKSKLLSLKANGKMTENRVFYNWEEMFWGGLKISCGGGRLASICLSGSLYVTGTYSPSGSENGAKLNPTSMTKTSQECKTALTILVSHGDNYGFRHGVSNEVCRWVSPHMTLLC